VSHFTLRIIIILMETIKDLYQTPTPPAVVGVCTGPKWLSKEAAIASLARMKAEAELASLYRERAIARAWAARRDPKKRAAVSGGSKCETGRCQSPKMVGRRPH
jgi:hypothetical protein